METESWGGGNGRRGFWDYVSTWGEVLTFDARCSCLQCEVESSARVRGRGGGSGSSQLQALAGRIPAGAGHPSHRSRSLTLDARLGHSRRPLAAAPAAARRRREGSGSAKPARIGGFSCCSGIVVKRAGSGRGGRGPTHPGHGRAPVTTEGGSGRPQVERAVFAEESQTRNCEFARPCA